MRPASGERKNAASFPASMASASCRERKPSRAHPFELGGDVLCRRAVVGKLHELVERAASLRGGEPPLLQKGGPSREAVAFGELSLGDLRNRHLGGDPRLGREGIAPGEPPLQRPGERRVGGGGVSSAVSPAAGGSPPTGRTAAENAACAGNGRRPRRRDCASSPARRRGGGPPPSGPSRDSSPRRAPGRAAACRSPPARRPAPRASPPA